MQGTEMRRREFIAGIGSAAASSTMWPLAARAQQGDRMRRIGVLMPFDENDRDWSPPLRDLGWIDGRNVRMDVRWGGGDVTRMQVLAKKLLGLQPDVILPPTLPPPPSLPPQTRPT